MSKSLSRRVVAEAVGTALLLAAVVGSGIMGERLAGGNTAVALLANTLATGAALVALILTFGPVSGAHFNPAVTLAEAWQGGLAVVTSSPTSPPSSEEASPASPLPTPCLGSPSSPGRCTPDTAAARSLASSSRPSGCSP
jgi:hypothetical protein